MYLFGFVSCPSLKEVNNVTTEGCVGLERPLVAGSWCYMLTFPAPADILLTGANSGKLEERERERIQN